MYGEVTQLDSDNKRPLNPALLILLSDRLLIGHPSTGVALVKRKFAAYFHLYNFYQSN